MRGDWQGPLYIKLSRWRTIAKSAIVGTRQQRITRETLGHRLKAAVEQLGVDATGFGSHSLRVGMGTASSEAGSTVQQSMGRTGQKTSKTVEDYIRPKAARDAALVLLGFALGWRVSELCSLDLSDITFVKDKGILVSLGGSKTDQEAHGRVVAVPFGSNEDTCPVRKLEAWIKMRGPEPGPLFSILSMHRHTKKNHLDPQNVRHLLKKVLRAIGADPRLYSTHSLRAGFVTTAYLVGASEKAIMARTGHRSVMTVLAYVRPLEGFQSDPLEGIL